MVLYWSKNVVFKFYRGSVSSQGEISRNMYKAPLKSCLKKDRYDGMNSNEDRYRIGNQQSTYCMVISLKYYNTISYLKLSATKMDISSLE